ncbi:MAG TPA: hypothetical protein VE954_09850 [Oligoflexus sp.]|uniref:hypothetical protein n=1 Tax=Oligoflexus sp. TaxID=1971216 RepID=UPI002D539004|nr:hypothetical protein [Oligoflexus sp.]HYX33405.1 hypothetical protein [Oligoflexus sp.]
MWQLTSYADLGWPADTVAVVAVNRQEVLCKRADASWVVATQGSHIFVPFAMPFPGTGTDPHRVIKWKNDDYLILMESKGLYRLKNSQQETLVTSEAILKMIPKNGSFYATDITVDRHQRVWMNGKPFRMLMLDLSDR